MLVSMTTTLPPSLPLPSAAQTLLWIRRPTETMRYCRKHLGPTFRIKLPPYELVILTDPESIRTVFSARSEDMHAGEVNRILRVLVGKSSVLLLDGPEHMRHRRLLMPSFHGERMRLYGATMAEVTRQVMASWPEGKPFSLHPHTQEITLEVILRTVFGADEGAQARELGAHIKSVLAAGEYRIAVLPMMYMSEHPELEGRAPWKWMLRARDRMDALLLRQIAARRAEGNAAARTDVLAMLLQARDEDGGGLSDLELRDELVTALAAGHETTATALAWAVERLLLHPRAYERLRDEVRALGPDPDPEQLAALPYLDASVKEALRTRPVVPVVGRVLKKPYQLGGYDLPAGTAVAPCVYLAHHDPVVYPEPEAFRPERFLDVQPDPASFLPFGGGIRRCVGAQFALYEAKIVLGSMLAARDFELAQDGPARIVRRAVTLWPKGGTVVRARVAPGAKRAA